MREVNTEHIVYMEKVPGEKKRWFRPNPLPPGTWVLLSANTALIVSETIDEIKAMLP